MSPAPHNFRATEKYLRVCTTGCLVCTCTSISVWKKLPGNGGQSGLARVENSPCNSESLATCSTRESSPVFRNYRNTMTDHISHFFPCCVNQLFVGRQRMKTEFMGHAWTRISTLAWYTLSVCHSQEP